MFKTQRLQIELDYLTRVVAEQTNRMDSLLQAFDKLFDALAYANGEDGSDFAHATRPARREEYPLYQGPTVWPTGPVVWRDTT